MKRKLVGGAAVLVVGLVAVWWFGVRGSGGTPETNAGSGGARSGKIEAAAPAPAAAQGDRSAQVPRGMAPRWSLDADKEGALRLEGQVVGPDGKGVGGAEVWLSSVPPRSTKSEDDGTFTFDKLVGRTYQASAKSGAMIGGPVTYKLTGKSDPLVIRLAEGASAVPLDAISWEQQRSLAVFTASQLVRCWTAMSSAGLPHGASTFAIEMLAEIAKAKEAAAARGEEPELPPDLVAPEPIDEPDAPPPPASEKDE